MYVLVTGATGRIGSHVTEALLGLGHRVRALVLPGDEERWAGRSGVDLVEGRLEDADAGSAAVHGVDAVVHLAGALSSRGCTDRQFIDYNTTGTFNLLVAARDRAPALRRFVYASSDAVYWSGDAGPASYLPVDELHPRVAGTVYGASKVCAEELCLSFWRGRGVPVTIARFSATADAAELVRHDSVFGRRMFLRSAIAWAEAQPAPTDAQVAALTALRAADDGTEKLFVFTDEAGGAGTININDARDAADAVVRMLEDPAAVGEAFNIGPIAPHAETELVGYLARRLDVPWVRVPVPKPRPSWYVSSLKARTVLGYAPTRTVFDMVDEALATRVGGG